MQHFHCLCQLDIGDYLQGLCDQQKIGAKIISHQYLMLACVLACMFV